MFGFFFIILIELELLESLRAHIMADQIHVKVIFTIALIAIARKGITPDMTKLSPRFLSGLAAVLFSLAAGYYLHSAFFTISSYCPDMINRS